MNFSDEIWVATSVVVKLHITSLNLNFAEV